MKGAYIVKGGAKMAGGGFWPKRPVRVLVQVRNNEPLSKAVAWGEEGVELRNWSEVGRTNRFACGGSKDSRVILSLLKNMSVCVSVCVCVYVYLCGYIRISVMVGDIKYATWNFSLSWKIVGDFSFAYSATCPPPSVQTAVIESLSCGEIHTF